MPIPEQIASGLQVARHGSFLERRNRAIACYDPFYYWTLSDRWQVIIETLVKEKASLRMSRTSSRPAFPKGSRTL